MSMLLCWMCLSPLDRTAVLLQRHCGSVLLWQCLQLRQLFYFLMSTLLLATTMKTTTISSTQSLPWGGLDRGELPVTTGRGGNRGWVNICCKGQQVPKPPT